MSSRRTYNQWFHRCIVDAFFAHAQIVGETRNLPRKYLFTALILVVEIVRNNGRFGGKWLNFLLMELIVADG